MNFLKRARVHVTRAMVFMVLWPSLARPLLGCACGCQIFEVGISDMPISMDSNRLTLEYSFMDQTENQSGSALADPATNPDKRITTSMFTLDLAHQFGHDWGLEAEIPYWQRGFTTDTQGSVGVTDSDAGVTPSIMGTQVNTLSDIRLMGMYTGLSEDMSLGITFGLKLPTGPFRADPLMDRDTEPGTGTTDLMLGAFDRGRFGSNWGWYVQTLLDAPLYERDSYQPGNNLDLVAGIHFDGLKQVSALTPLLQANVSVRSHDSGGGDAANGNADSGYENLFITPGLQAGLGRHVQATVFVYLPVSRNVNGDQLVAPWLVDAQLSYFF
jgi:hypothetical protein